LFSLDLVFCKFVLVFIPILVFGARPLPHVGCRTESGWDLEIALGVLDAPWGQGDRSASRRFRPYRWFRHLDSVVSGLIGSLWGSPASYYRGIWVGSWTIMG
jgi:hypothetical protein